MKKFIITSLCTLALTVISIFGGDSNPSESSEEINENNSIIDIETETTEVEDKVNNSEGEVIIEDEVSQEPEIEDNVETPTEDEEITLVQKPQKEEAIEDILEEETQKEEPKKEVPQKKESKKEQPQKKEKPQQEERKDESEVYDINLEGILDRINNNNGKTFVYKNVDLSQCETTDDIMNELGKYGFNIIDKSSEKRKPEVKQPKKETPEVKPPKKDNPEVKPPVNDNRGNYDNATLAGYADEVLRLVNQERAKAGLSTLTTETNLTAAANKRAQESRQSFSHTRPNGTSFSTVLREYGVSYRTSGENIAYGQRSPQEVVTGWMNSPGHRANILNGNFNKIGIGVYQSNGTLYWAQLFTN